MSTMVSEAAVAAAIPLVIDRTYVLHDQLGQGGMGAVYEATNRISGERVALKLVSDERRDTEDGDDDKAPGDDAVARRRLALSREFQTLASLHHPHVVRVLSYGFDQTRGPYYTMELLRSAQTLVEAAQNRPLRDKIQLLAQLLRALEYVHRRGICHRDIKPKNIAVVEARRSGFPAPSRVSWN
jgi:serine/threonine protein kinase